MTNQTLPWLTTYEALGKDRHTLPALPKIDEEALRKSCHGAK